MIELSNIGRGMYFIIAADAYIDGVNLGDYLVEVKFAYVYDAVKKKLWCK